MGPPSPYGGYTDSGIMPLFQTPFHILFDRRRYGTERCLHNNLPHSEHKCEATPQGNPPFWCGTRRRSVDAVFGSASDKRISLEGPARLPGSPVSLMRPGSVRPFVTLSQEVARCCASVGQCHLLPGLSRPASAAHQLGGTTRALWGPPKYRYPYSGPVDPLKWVPLTDKCTHGAITVSYGMG